MTAKTLGLYVHIPFCEAICNYCNFNRGLLDPTLKKRYLLALQREIQLVADGTPADSVFFGGGTPSVLEPGEVSTLIAVCQASFALDPGAEVTLEMNPETVSQERLDGYRVAGVNRVSLGVQSLQDVELKRLGRLHTAARAIDAFQAARAAGFDNVSVDLMVWLPQQTVPQWHETVDTVIGLAPEHVSLYLLELYPNAPLREDMARAGWAQAPEDLAAEMYHTGIERFEAAGLRQYEISNVAQKGRRSRHNLKYWSDGNWIGFGCGAHSTRDRHRWHNVAGVDTYIDRVNGGRSPVAMTQPLSDDDQVRERLFLGLRLVEGVVVTEVEEHYGVDVWARWGDELALCIDAGLLHPDAKRLRLTRDGMLLANEVMQVFV